VNPAVDEALSGLLELRFGVRPRYLAEHVPVPMRVRFRHAEKVGVDRLANAVGAWSLAKGPAIVVDFGTAITVDAISSKGDFLGGAIVPGVRLSAQSLHEGTAKLPLVEPKRPRSVIGKQTEDAMRAGIYWGACGAVKEIAARSRRRLGNLNAPLFATGGDAKLFAGDLPKPARVVPDLTLKGIAIAFERWQANRQDG
jgi:type III pantothenate kinase